MEYFFFAMLPITVFGIVLFFYFKNKRKNNEFVLTNEFKKILNLLKNSNDHVFITGKAGTGKSTLLKYFIKNTKKKFIVLAPTGIAALNIGGQTIHSFFRFPPSIINSRNINPDFVRAGLFKQLQMVIIDEVSMVRSDMIHGIDIALRKNRNIDKPFGGVQMVFIGDLFQLPPIVKDEEREYIVNKYGGKYFFDAPVFDDLNFHFSELTHIFRQSEKQTQFKGLLNNIRENQVSFDNMVLLNTRHRDNAGDLNGSIFLTTKRSIARELNREKLQFLNSKEFVFEGEVTGSYLAKSIRNREGLENILPAPYILTLKKGAQIMMLKNDKAHRWVNGSLGVVESLSNDEIIVSIKGTKHIVEKERWEEMEYIMDGEDISTKVTSEFIQYPLRLSYAMTIHKSQGKTLEKITIDIGSGAFAPGQVYVALSRAITFEEVRLNKPVQNKDIFVDERVVSFYKHKVVPFKEKAVNTKAVQQQLEKAIKDDLKIQIDYQKTTGESNIRVLSDIKYSNDYIEQGNTSAYIEAFCHMRKAKRNFKVARIRSIKIMDANLTKSINVENSVKRPIMVNKEIQGNGLLSFNDDAWNFVRNVKDGTFTETEENYVIEMSNNISLVFPRNSEIIAAKMYNKMLSADLKLFEVCELMDSKNGNFLLYRARKKEIENSFILSSIGGFMDGSSIWFTV